MYLATKNDNYMYINNHPNKSRNNTQVKSFSFYFLCCDFFEYVNRKYNILTLSLVLWRQLRILIVIGNHYTQTRLPLNISMDSATLLGPCTIFLFKKNKKMVYNDIGILHVGNYHKQSYASTDAQTDVSCRSWRLSHFFNINLLSRGAHR